MEAKQLWQRYCKYYRYYPTVGISIDISRMRFADDFMSSMKPQITQAFSAMDALEKGELANPDEGRMVGHYWLRTPELSPTPALRKEIETTLSQIETFAHEVHSGKISPPNGGRFDRLVIVGIGGSALGPQLVADALGSRTDKMSISFCDNTDPDGLARILQNLSTHLQTTLCIVISKSGGTPETRNGAIEFAAAYKRAGLSFPKHAVAVTCEGSKLDKQAISEGWIRRFPMWDWVGGRTSLFSAVGLLPAALQGIDIRAFVEGGKQMDAITRMHDSEGNPAMLLSLMWHFAGSGAGKKDMVVLPYKDRLMLFSKYLQQLVMESLGKELNLKGQLVNQGIAVYGNKGSTDQHAYVQQLRDGLNNFFATFIQVLQDKTADSADHPVLEVDPGVTCGDYLTGFFLGTRRALFENQRDSISISVDSLDTKSLGSLIALYDRAVGFYASLVGINAYHQPGVEAGKKAAAQVLDVQKATFEALAQNRDKALTAADVAAAAKLSDEVETVYKVLEHLAANPHTRVAAEGERHPEKLRFRLNAD